MGWRFFWVSSGGCDFNQDFAVTFSKEELAAGAKSYNFGTTVPHREENPGLSLFYKDSNGGIFHTYSTYGRGLETMLGTYTILDRAPKGRDEDSQPAGANGLGTSFESRGRARIPQVEIRVLGVMTNTSLATNCSQRFHWFDFAAC